MHGCLRLKRRGEKERESEGENKENILTVCDVMWCDVGGFQQAKRGMHVLSMDQVRPKKKKMAKRMAKRWQVHILPRNPFFPFFLLLTHK